MTINTSTFDWSRMRRFLVGSAAVIGLLAISSCSNNDESTTTTTTAAPTSSTDSSSATREIPGGFQITTADGQISVSLDGKLPPNWPADFPVPPGATPIGFGSLGGKEKTALVGVYRSTDTAENTLNFYTQNSALKISRPASVGSGTSYVGSFKMTAPYSGRVTVVSQSPGSVIIAALGLEGTTNSTAPTTTTAP